MVLSWFLQEAEPIWKLVLGQVSLVQPPLLVANLGTSPTSGNQDLASAWHRESSGDGHLPRESRGLPAGAVDLDTDAYLCIENISI